MDYEKNIPAEDITLDETQVEHRETLVLHEGLVKERLSKKKYFLHGNSSPEDSKSIATSGLRGMEGRATVSCNLVHAFDWAASAEKRQAYSRSETPTEKESSGSVFVVEKLGIA